MLKKQNSSISILLLAPYSANAVGGQAKFATELGTKLAQEFNIYYLSPPDRLNIKKITRPIYSLIMFIRLLGMVRKNNIRILHLFTPCNRLALYEKLLLGIISKKIGIKVILNFRDSIEINYKVYSKFEWRFIIYILNKFDIVLSQYQNQNLFLLNEGVKKNKLEFIYNGISLNELKKFSCEDRSYVDILFIGEIGKRKGVDLILKAVNNLLNEDKETQKFKVSIYGFEFKKGFKNDCNKFIAKNNLERYIELYPPITGNDKYHRLSQSDIFLLPSNSEGFPNGVLEAMLYGKAIITSNVGALEEVIDDGIHGLKILPGDVESLSNNLKLLINDEAMRNYLGNNARMLIDEKFKLADIHEHYSNLYQKLG